MVSKGAFLRVQDRHVHHASPSNMDKRTDICSERSERTKDIRNDDTSTSMIPKGKTRRHAKSAARTVQHALERSVAHSNLLASSLSLQALKQAKTGLVDTVVVYTYGLREAGRLCLRFLSQ